MDLMCPVCSKDLKYTGELMKPADGQSYYCDNCDEIYWYIDEELINWKEFTQRDSEGEADVCNQ